MKLYINVLKSLARKSVPIQVWSAALKLTPAKSGFNRVCGVFVWLKIPS
ncbi:MAG: hypothetical protein FWG90_00105 [Oscillospiraceae bacterium]|nr:hypothetical protein [Oscillospiraceae bacterium]